MKKIAYSPLIFAILFLASITAACIDNADSSAGRPPPENETEIAICTALNNETVQSYLEGPWRIQTVNPYGYVSIAPGGSGETVINTTNVAIETQTNIVHVYVDVHNRTVVSIWAQPIRAPMPVRNESAGT